MFFNRCAESGDWNGIYTDPKAVFSVLLEKLKKSTVQRSKFVHKTTGFEIYRDEVRRNPPASLGKGELAKYIGRKWKRFRQEVRDEYIKIAITR